MERLQHLGARRGTADCQKPVNPILEEGRDSPGPEIQDAELRLTQSKMQFAYPAMLRAALCAAMMATAIASTGVPSGTGHYQSGMSVQRSSWCLPSSMLSMRLRGGSDDVITEPVTGIGFSATLTAGNETLTFVGCGDRKKAIIGPVAVNVYAVGLYVDADAAKGDAPAILRSGAQAAARALQQGEYTKALKIIMARSVASDNIGNALAEALEPKVKGPELAEFKAFFAGLDKLNKGDQIVFSQVGSALKVQVPTGTTEFASPALSRAMFDIYLGDSPVSPNGKQAMAEGLIKLCG